MSKKQLKAMKNKHFKKKKAVKFPYTTEKQYLCSPKTEIQTLQR